MGNAGIMGTEYGMTGWTRLARGGLWLMTAMAACYDRGSLGNYDSGGSDGVTGSESSTAGEGGEASITGASASTGSGVRCGGQGCQLFEPPCGDQCGALDSPFDAEGCLRASCADGSQCAQDEVCFVAQDYGLCAGSGWFCEDSVEEAACMCGSDPNCGGGFCVPASLAPAVEAAPVGAAAVVRGCPDEIGDRFSFTIYDTAMLSGCEPAQTGLELLELQLHGTVEPGSFQQSASEPLGVLYEGVDELEVWTVQFGFDEDTAEATASGTFEVLVLAPDGTPKRYAGEFADAPVCELLVACG